MKNSVLQNVAEAEIPRYEALIIGDRAKGEPLLREFGMFGNKAGDLPYFCGKRAFSVLFLWPGKRQEL